MASIIDQITAVYYRSKTNEEYILSCCEHVGIHKYDINNYPKQMNDINLLNHGCVINETNDRLYFFGSISILFAIFHIETKKWDIKCCEPSFSLGES